MVLLGKKDKSWAFPGGFRRPKFSLFAVPFPRKGVQLVSTKSDDDETEPESTSEDDEDDVPSLAPNSSSSDEEESDPSSSESDDGDGSTSVTSSSTDGDTTSTSQSSASDDDDSDEDEDVPVADGGTADSASSSVSTISRQDQIATIILVPPGGGDEVTVEVQTAKIFQLQLGAERNRLSFFERFAACFGRAVSRYEVIDEAEDHLGSVLTAEAAESLRVTLLGFLVADGKTHDPLVVNLFKKIGYTHVNYVTICRPLYHYLIGDASLSSMQIVTCGGR